jgi:hypothetical protein
MVFITCVVLTIKKSSEAGQSRSHVPAFFICCSGIRRSPAIAVWQCSPSTDGASHLPAAIVYNQHRILIEFEFELNLLGDE